MTVYNNDRLEKKRDNLTEEIMKLAGIVDSYERKSRDAWFICRYHRYNRHWSYSINHRLIIDKHEIYLYFQENRIRSDAILILLNKKNACTYMLFLWFSYILENCRTKCRSGIYPLMCSADNSCVFPHKTPGNERSLLVVLTCWSCKYRKKLFR